MSEITAKTDPAPISGLVAMISVADGAQDVLFYLYAANLEALRSQLLAAATTGAISYPEYLPSGEFRVQDPDGYTLMIAQSTADSP